jgi:long-chain acyl-CoA synthetase
VPRLLNRLYDKVLQGVNESLVKRTMFALAMRAKKSLLQQGIVSQDTVWDRLVFQKIRDLLGGRIRFVCSGAAPINPEILTFLRCALGCHVYEGYGQTESAAVATLTLAGDFTPGAQPLALGRKKKEKKEVKVWKRIGLLMSNMDHLM